MRRTLVHPWAATLATGLVLLLLGSTTSLAQGRAEGSIVGKVTDETKGVLPGVTVTAINTATGLSRVSVTESDGAFRLSALPPGPYEVKAELAGFGVAKKGVTVTIGAEATLDLVMGVGTLEETVTVSGEAPLVEVTKTEQSMTFSSKEIANLPTNTRNFLDFALLSPGVVRGRSSGAGFGSEGGASASGNRGDENAVNIDGVVNKSLDNGTDQGSFSQEGVQEFQIITQGYPAEFGGAAGAVINAVTKSGTNNASAYGYLFLRDNRFDKPPFDLVTNTDGTREAKPASQANQFRRMIGGVVLGGPIKKDKLFYFGLFEHTSSNTPRVRTIPDATLAAVKQIVIPNLRDDASNKVSQFKPTANRVTLKTDWNMSAKHSASVRLGYTRTFSPAGTANGAVSVINASESKFTNMAVGITWNAVLSNTRINSLRAQYYNDNTRQDYPSLGGFENIANFPPQIVIGGATGGTFGRQNAGGFPHTEETKWEIQDAYTVYLNKHAIKFGGQYIHVPFYQINDYGPDGQWRFSDINAFLAGRPSSFLQTWGPGGVFMKVNYISAFVQDEWQPNASLTVNYGVRYQLDHYPTDITSYTLPEPAFDPTSRQFTTQAGSPNMKGYENDTNNLAPRFGLTYTPDKGKTVMRLAGGAFYGNNYLGEMANGMGWDGFPSSQRYTFTSAQAREMWAGIVTPGSPYFNSTGIRRLPGSYFSVLQNQPFTRIPFNSKTSPPESVQANVGVERQLGDVFAVSATYLWSRGWHNVRNYNTNPQAPTPYRTGSLLPTGTITPFDINLRLGPRPDPRFGEVLEYANVGGMKFKGLTLAASARWPNLQAKASYTYNGAYDDSVAISFNQGPSDLTCLSCEYSESVLNVQRFVGSLVYTTPKTWGAFGRDFQVAGIIERETGHPFQVQAGFDFNNDTIATDRPNGVPRNALITDPRFSADLRVTRAIPIRGRVKAEVMFEMFNLLNTPHFENYDGNLYVLQGGVYVPRPDFAAFAASSKLNDLDVNRDPKEIGLNPKLRRTAVGDPFQGQLGIRFHF